MGLWSNGAEINRFAEQLLRFLEADARERITRHAERLERRIQEPERLTRTPMSPGNSATPDAEPPPPVDTP